MTASFLPASSAPLFKLAGFILLASGFYLLFFPAGKKAASGSSLRKILGAGIIVLGLLLPAVIPTEGVVWSAYQPELVEQARLQRMPVALDFYAAWCVPCLQMERYTFSDPAVIRELDRFARIKIDVTDMNSPRTQSLLKQYGVQSVPVLLFLDRNGKEIPDSRIDGFVKPEELLSLLQGPRLKA